LLTYPATISLSTPTLIHLADLLRHARTAAGTRWRRLDPGRQALLVLAHLRNGDTYARLAAGFGIGVATAYRYIREALDLLAATAPRLDQAVYRAARLLYVILDGTLIPIDRVLTSGPTTRGGIAATESTSRSSPALAASCCGPHQRCPARSMTYAPPAPTTFRPR
jgi:hypothetical protein